MIIGELALLWGVSDKHYRLLVVAVVLLVIKVVNMLKRKKGVRSF